MGLFKKKQYADTIYYGGKIYTMDSDYPVAEAVAVKDGTIIAVGEFQAIADDLQNKDTVLYDLKNKFMTPGLIDINCDVTPLYLRELADKQQKEAEAQRKALEESGIDEDEIEEAEEEEIEAEELPEDFFDQPDSELEPAKPEIDSIEKALYIRGVTTILNVEHNNQADDYFKNLLMERWQDGTLKQRYYGSVNISRMVDIRFLVYYLEQKRTLCNELEGFINASHVDFSYSSDENADNYISEEYLAAVSEELAEHGYSIRFDPADEKGAEYALALVDDLKDAYKKLSFIVRSSANNKTQLEAFTTEAAAALGVSKILGSIEEGKYADFAIFDFDPMAVFGPARTILAGKEIIL